MGEQGSPDGLSLELICTCSSNELPSARQFKEFLHLEGASQLLQSINGAPKVWEQLIIILWPLDSKPLICICNFLHSITKHRGFSLEYYALLSAFQMSVLKNIYTKVFIYLQHLSCFARPEIFEYAKMYWSTQSHITSNYSDIVLDE